MNNNHMSALKIKHQELQSKLEHEENRPLPDSGTILNLKKQKLRLKDVMTKDVAAI